MFVCCQYIKRPYGPVGEAAVERSQAHKGIGPKKTRPPSLTLTLTGRCQIPPGSSVRPMELFLWQVQVRPCKLRQRPFLRISRVEHILILRGVLYFENEVGGGADYILLMVQLLCISQSQPTSQGSHHPAPSGMSL